MKRRSAAAALLAAAACALPVAAQQQAVGGGSAPLALPLHPTEAGKPVIYDPQFVAKSGDDKAGDDKGCAPGFSCRLRLLGVIQNNGAVELRATAFTW
jgi:hypothetical protein